MTSFRQDVNVGLVTFVGAVGAMVLLILVLGVQAWFGYETDEILKQRYAADDNVDWIALKAEQYANIGDTVGNDTIYAHEVPPPERFLVTGEGSASDRFDYRGVQSGYRFADEAKTQLIVPIHQAMAAVIKERGGIDVSADEMAAIDEGGTYYVHLTNNTFRDPQSHVEVVEQPEQPDAGQSATDGE